MVKEHSTSRTVEIERRSFRSEKSFEEVTRAIEAAVGRPDMAEYLKAARSAKSFAEIDAYVRKTLGPSGFVMFLKLDLGGILRAENGLSGPNIVRYVIGNPLIMKEMVKHVPDAGSYAPLTILIDERADGVYLTFDTMSSLLEPYESGPALAVARMLDAKTEALIHACAF